MTKVVEKPRIGTCFYSCLFSRHWFVTIYISILSGKAYALEMRPIIGMRGMHLSMTIHFPSSIISITGLLSDGISRHSEDTLFRLSRSESELPPAFWACITI